MDDEWDNQSVEVVYQFLFDMPIEQLDLSSHAIEQLQNYGVESVGDCISFYRICMGGMVDYSMTYGEVMYGEVKNKIQDLGYWYYVENMSNGKNETQ